MDPNKINAIANLILSISLFILLMLLVINIGIESF